MDLAFFIAALVAAAIVPMLLGVVATRRLGTLLGSFLVGLALGGAAALIDPILGGYGLFAWFMAALPGDRWRLLHAVHQAMQPRRHRR